MEAQENLLGTDCGRDKPFSLLGAAWCWGGVLEARSWRAWRAIPRRGPLSGGVDEL